MTPEEIKAPPRRTRVDLPTSYEDLRAQLRRQYELHGCKALDQRAGLARVGCAAVFADIITSSP